MMRREAGSGAVITDKARYFRVRPFGRVRVETDTHPLREREARIPRGARLGTNTGTFDTSLDRRGWLRVRSCV